MVPSQVNQTVQEAILQAPWGENRSGAQQDTYALLLWFSLVAGSRRKIEVRLTEFVEGMIMYIKTKERIGTIV